MTYKRAYPMPVVASYDPKANPRQVLPYTYGRRLGMTSLRAGFRLRQGSRPKEECQQTFSQTISMEHKTAVNAVVGQNISLQCIVLKENLKFIQLQWYKQDEHGEQRLVMFNPLYPILYYANVILEPMRETNTRNLLGSILHLQEVTEKDSGVYSCDLTSFPDGRKKYLTKVQVTDLDNIECNSESQIQIESKTNFTITCEAKSSRSLYFDWIKDNMTVFSGASLNLWMVRPDQSGMYTLIVHTENDHLHKRKYFTITVTNRTHTEDLSTTMIMETTSQTTTTHEPDVTSQTSQPQHNSSTSEVMSTKVMYISTSAPSTGNSTMVHIKDTTHVGVVSTDVTFTLTSSEDSTSSPGSTSRKSDHDTSTFIFTFGFTATRNISDDLTTKITKQNGSMAHAVFIIIPFLLMLVLIGFLYRKYLIQKRFENEGQENLDNPIYGNIFVDGRGGSMPMSEYGNNKQMPKKATRQDEQSGPEDVSYASLDLRLVKKHKKKKRSREEQNQTHMVQTYPAPVPQMRCTERTADCDGALPSRSSSLTVSRSSIYLNSHQVALKTDELQRRRERERKRETEWENNYEWELMKFHGKLRDFLLVYNRMTEICFQRCTNNFNYRNLTMDEEHCADSCAGKLIRSNHRLMGTYVQLMPAMVQKRMEELESKAAEMAKSTEAGGSVEPLAGGSKPLNALSNFATPTTGVLTPTATAEKTGTLDHPIPVLTEHPHTAAAEPPIAVSSRQASLDVTSPLLEGLKVSAPPANPSVPVKSRNADVNQTGVVNSSISPPAQTGGERPPS
ncbi:Mitochondrial import inner membrane translocase subunit Tim10 B [Bagarius yarrelli]|uniref:Mitochondrial import inner membrane translocase subunit Tim10 B n=1 Tax=Bagarius yarrelli TaxID=175774 RepID=A0A556TK31_BAGYA|nr:Mitochondrial import inner membrane translocase subunit Tim10 B [Bagarius yarrelli]